ncbi:hypothetical protein JCM5296_004928 [Sporobolomyces johnsonii]
MADDELDPAFLDLDLAQHGSNSLGDSFDRALDLDLDSQLHNGHTGDDLGSSLGAGFGNALGHELEFDHRDEEHSPRSRQSTGETAHGPAAGGSELSTPRRRTGSGNGASPASGQHSANRMSLAFELASAASPGTGRSRDLMRELGIDEDEDEQEGHGEGDEDDEEELEGEEEDRFGQEALGRKLFHRASDVQDDRDDLFGSTSSSSRQQPPRPRIRPKPSSVSLASFATSFEDDFEAGSVPSQEELDAAFQEATAALQSSMGATGTFLSHLRQHVTADVDSHVPVAAAAATSPASSLAPPPSTSLNGSLQRTLSSQASSSSLTPPPPQDFTDRQPIVEKLASRYIKSLYDLAKQREGQLRELTEMERVFARNEAGWRSVLAEVDPLPPDEDDDDDEQRDEATTTPYLDPDASLPSSSPAIDPASLPPPAASASATPRRPSRNVSTSTSHELTDLRRLTSSLLSALSSISDVAQVQSALTSESGRKLRALRQQVVAVREDLTSLERSEEFVREYEASEAAEGGRGKGRYAERARREMEGAQKELEDGWRRAQSVLAARA